VKKIRVYGDRALRCPAKEITKIDGRLHALIREMKETIEQAGGLGLAAPQVGSGKRLFIVRDTRRDRILTLINPRIIEESGTAIDMEGCLSFPGVYIAIERPSRVVVEAVNEHGKSFVWETAGIEARCVRHESDHLDGVLIIDHASEEEKRMWHQRLEELRSRARKR